MNLIFLYGPPASGKLTIARELAGRTGYKLLHNHQTFDLLEPLFGVFNPVFTPLLNQLRLDIIRTAATTDIPGMIVTHVYGSGEADFIFELKQAIEKHGGRAYFVRLVTQPDELDRRVQQESRHEFKKLRSPEELRRLMADWDVTQEIPGVENLSIDNTDKSVAQVADQILEHCNLTTTS